MIFDRMYYAELRKGALRNFEPMPKQINLEVAMFL